LTWYRPSILVVERHTIGNRRSERMRSLIALLKAEAAAHGLASRAISWRAAKVFWTRSAAATKRDVAVELTAHFPELLPRLPRRRRIWMSEDPRITIFTSLAYALTYLFTRRRTARPSDPS
jgi:hypothetical protein